MTRTPRTVVAPRGERVLGLTRWCWSSRFGYAGARRSPRSQAGRGLTGWTVFGPAGQAVSIVSGSFSQAGVSFPAQDGAQWVDLTGFNNNSTEGVSQSVATTVGHQYQLSYFTGNTTGGGIFGSTSTVDVLLNGVLAFTDTNSTISPLTQN